MEEEDKANPSFLSQLQKRSRNLNKKLSQIKLLEIQIRNSEITPTEESKAKIQTKPDLQQQLAEVEKITKLYKEYQ
jgi:hypothetical protein